MKEIYLNIQMTFKLFIASLKSMMIYKFDFVVGILSQSVYQLIELIFIFIVFGRNDNIGGWNIYQVLLLYGILNMSLGVNDFIFDEMYQIGPKLVRTGKFDIFMLRPIHPILSVIGNTKSVTAVGYIIIGMAIAAYALINLNIAITLPLVLMLIYFAIMGGAIIGGVISTIAIVGLWIYNSNEIIWSTFIMYKFAQYPLNIYNIVIRTILTFVIPYAFVSYYPSLFLMGENSGVLILLIPFIAIRFMDNNYNGLESCFEIL